jgi:hypothetical protein
MALIKYVMQPTPSSDARRYASAEFQKIEKFANSIIVDSTDIRAALEAAQDDIADLFAADVVADTRLDALETATTPATGLWQMSLKGLTSAGVGTYTAQEGFYIKVGNIVMVAARTHWSAHTGTGQLNAFGLPFTPTALVRPTFPQVYMTGSVWSTIPQATKFLLRGGADSIDIYNADSSACNIAASGQIILSAMYWT